MQSIQLQNDSLVEIATFLIRRWSEKENVTIEISNNIETKTRLKENKVILQIEILKKSFKKTDNFLNNIGYKSFNKFSGRGQWISNFYYKNFD